MAQSMVSIFLKEGLEFCYTQEQGVLGVTKQSVKDKFGVFIPRVIINFSNDRYGVEIEYVTEDEEYLYIKEV